MSNDQDLQVITFGCRLNTYESEVMRNHARAAGLGPETIIVNTCAVTKEAERQARQAIRRAKRDNPLAEIIVTGCSAQISPDAYAAMPEVARVIGNDVKLDAASWIPEAPKSMVGDIMAVRETAHHLIEGFEGQARAFLQVQNGCDHRCTFCIIPYGRGNSRSVPIGDIAAQMRKLVEAGYKEIVLTGVDVTSYGADLPGQPRLGQMIRRVLALVPDLPRLRLSSLDPVEIDDDLWRLIAEEPRLMPHLHLSLQAGDDMILKRMKRRHLRNDVIEVCKRARGLRPDIAFGADIIAGFPTETDAMFQNSLDIVDECDLTFLHIFPYSERDGTPAARMPQVDPQKRKDRAGLLREKGEKQLSFFLRNHMNKERQIVVEKDKYGHTEHFAPVCLHQAYPAGSLLTVMTGAIVDGRLTATVVS